MTEKKAGATAAEKKAAQQKRDGNIGCIALIALAAFIFFGAKACSSDSSSSSSASSSDPSASADAAQSAAAASDDAVAGSPPAQTATYSCGGVTFTVTSNGNDVTVDRAGEASETAVDFTEYAVTINRNDGNKVRMLYQKNYTSGEPASVFIYDASGGQTNLPSDDRTSLRYPNALKGFGEQGWHGNAAINVDGKDVATCS